MTCDRCRVGAFERMDRFADLLGARVVSALPGVSSGRARVVLLTLPASARADDATRFAEGFASSAAVPAGRLHGALAAELPAAVLLSRDQYEQRLPFVRRTAMRLARRVPASISVGDLVGSGFVGLVEALADAAPGASDEELDAYLRYRIRGAMLDFVRSADDRTHRIWSQSRRLVRIIGRLDRDLGRAPDEGEIAAGMGLSRGEYRALLRAIAGVGQVPLEAVSLDPERDDEAQGGDLGLPALDVALAKAIARLPEEQQHVLALRHQEGCTDLEIAMVLDLDEDRVVEHHAEAVHRLRAAVESRREAARGERREEKPAVSP